MKYYVVGGVYEDFTFSEVQEGYEEEHGPFDSYEEASRVWKSRMWLNVDNALHKLSIETGE